MSREALASSSKKQSAVEPHPLKTIAANRRHGLLPDRARD